MRIVYSSRTLPEGPGTESDFMSRVNYQISLVQPCNSLSYITLLQGKESMDLMKKDTVFISHFLQKWFIFVVACAFQAEHTQE